MAISSFIIVLDTVLPVDEAIGLEKGQMVRKEPELLDIFARAGLEIYKSSELKTLHDDYFPVKVWALFKDQTTPTITID